MKADSEGRNLPHWAVDGRTRLYVVEVLPQVFLLFFKDAVEALEEQQRPRVLHVRREEEYQVWHAEGTTQERLDQALRCVQPLPEALCLPSLLPQGTRLLQGLHPRMPPRSEKRHPPIEDLRFRIFQGLTPLAPTLKICDFGYSKSSEFHSQPKSTVGKPDYIAPNVLCKREYDGKKFFLPHHLLSLPKRAL
ncbi:uncharacterized protein LOC144716227 isoform X2 [Wolffia australiana]